MIVLDRHVIYISIQTKNSGAIAMKSWTLLVCLLATGARCHHPSEEGLDITGRKELLPGVEVVETDKGIIDDFAWEALQHLEQATNYIYARAFAEDQVSSTFNGNIFHYSVKLDMISRSNT